MIFVNIYLFLNREKFDKNYKIKNNMAWLHKTHLPSNNKRGCFFKASFSVIFYGCAKI